MDCLVSRNAFLHAPSARRRIQNPLIPITIQSTTLEINSDTVRNRKRSQKSTAVAICPETRKTWKYQIITFHLLGISNLLEIKRKIKPTMSRAANHKGTSRETKAMNSTYEMAHAPSAATMLTNYSCHTDKRLHLYQ